VTDPAPIAPGESFWSLAVEVQIYCLFPLLILLARRFGLKPVVIGSLILGLLWQRLCLALWPHASWETSAAAFNAVPGRLVQFVVGMACAQFVARPREGQERVALAVLSSMATLTILIGGAASGSRGSEFGVWPDHLWAIVFGALVVAMAKVPAAWFEAPLSVGRALTGLGKISYSVYLIHLPLLTLLSLGLFPVLSGPPTAVFGVFFLVALPFLVIAGRVFHGLFEAPTWLSRRRNAQLAQAAIATLPQ
jgi:peptidoglycan/LPS O-acetylase OafA/YrhL